MASWKMIESTGHRDLAVMIPTSFTGASGENSKC